MNNIQREETYEVSQPTQNEERSRTNFYRTIWRWHLYAGIIFAPFLIILAITGSVYLFKPQIENIIYQEYYEVTPEADRISATDQIDSVKNKFPDATVTQYRPGESKSRSSEVKISTEETTSTIFVNPYTGKIIGQLSDDDRIMNKIEEIHGELMIGTTGDRIVELVACWAVVLIVTGLFLWFPRKNKQLSGVLVPRLSQGRKILRRDLHAVPAFWITAGMLFLILTGLPWSGFWGANFQSIATNNGVGYPPSIWGGEAPVSAVQTKDVAEVPWAAETLEVPESKVEGIIPVSVDDIVTIAEQQGMDPSFSVSIPNEPTGVYTLSAYPAKAEDEATIHLDQYSGAVLADYRFEHYGIVGKIVALGITLHKGTQFGLINQFVSLLICLGIMLVAVSGFYLWLKRKPKKGTGAPKGPSAKTMKLFLFTLIFLGILFPLVGLSLLVIWLIDWLIIQRVSSIRRFLNA
ncbi:PepSY domain-containing protein [Fictibacillus sp. 7GRE50]|uniref:PepSY-associated TM helix domain-containing protein n=1 Tax=unclassified Fictibacillus TaxID=2644029 RepID=UPI0018CF5096|nr:MULTISPECIES: PepSY domain-containing protein [unclassified Fictibacillus]MBH0166882.1 PepSY domain-containing protein [Fictibacillus sp. 7GRE50]MBH0173496.1 PepSY domain-containing protein [Fictibacillus sp. 23RED33]